jgi:hypothetical protein
MLYYMITIGVGLNNRLDILHKFVRLGIFICCLLPFTRLRGPLLIGLTHSTSDAPDYPASGRKPANCGAFAPNLGDHSSRVARTPPIPLG